MDQETFLRDWVKIRITAMLLVGLVALYITYRQGFKQGQIAAYEAVQAYLSENAAPAPHEPAPMDKPDDETLHGSTK